MRPKREAMTASATIAIARPAHAPMSFTTVEGARYVMLMQPPFHRGEVEGKVFQQSKCLGKAVMGSFLFKAAGRQFHPASVWQCHTSHRLPVSTRHLLHQTSTHSFHFEYITPSSLPNSFFTTASLFHIAFILLSPDVLHFHCPPLYCL